MRRGEVRTFSGLLLAGLAAGAAVGLIDGIIGLPGAGQFLRGFGGYFGYFVMALALYAVAGGAAGLVCFGLLRLLLRSTGPGVALGTWWSDGRDWAAVAAYGLAGIFGLGPAVMLLQKLAVVVIRGFHHQGLIAAVIATLALFVLGLGLLLTLLLGRLGGGLFRPLFKHLGRPGWLAPVIALAIPALALAGLLAGLTAWQWEVVQYLPLRFMAVMLGIGSALVMLGLCLPSPASSWLKLAAWVLPLTLLLLVHLLSFGQALRKAGDMNLVLARPLLGAARKIVDLDRDGYSALFGGGDCDDWDGEVYPGAFDWPDDEIDQNCLGGDAKVRDREPGRIFDVPDDVPDELNVLLITVDALVAGHLGCYGYERDTSPELDRFAKTAVLFERSFAHAPSTRYSFPAIMTSRYPASVQWGEGSWPPPVVPENLTWAEVMKGHGLHTAAILNYRFFKPEWGLNQGFDFYDNSRSRLHSGRSDPATHGVSSDQMADATIEFLDKNGHRRFFLWVHFYDPHWYYETHPGFSIFGDSRVDLYDGEIRFTDHHIGRVISHLEETGLSKNTVVIITGDHGEGFGEHGVMLHGYHLYNPQTHVPILFRVPELPPRRVEREPVGHVDLLPTVVNLLRGEPSPSFQGASVLDLMMGEAAYPRHIFQEVWFADKGPFARIVGLVTARWKLLYNEQPSGTFELYDLDEDFEETSDLWGQSDPDEEDRLRRILVRHLEEDHLPPDFHERVAPNISDAPFDDCPQNVHVVYGDPPVAELLGVEVEPLLVKAGGRVRIVTWWRAFRPVESGWKLFMHLIPKKGKYINADHEPVSGFYGLQKWRPGDYLRDIQEITIDRHLKPGRYGIVTGLYRKKDRIETEVYEGATLDKKGGAVIGELRIER